MFKNKMTLLIETVSQIFLLPKLRYIVLNRVLLHILWTLNSPSTAPQIHPVPGTYFLFQSWKAHNSMEMENKWHRFNISHFYCF